ncbi:hypothetical protein [Sinorhizobium alkalisoli]|uniref:hypothetical protein n=1 Tax=Sinorhizobium alkalisoli TaxID=1752398 RepID=UPI0012A7F053|nr:hypothetical protein [Sinorhizobium alkalisoli]QFI70812.1 hypothetical protein EKH55_5938 [Sinorhizobium alkalisoli]
MALAVAIFGRLREESRGAHARSDFRQTNPEPVRRQMTFDQVIEASRHFATRPLARTA